MTPTELREFARTNNWQEDFERFDDATLGGWIKDYWDEGAKKFRSSRGATGHFEKPTECPNGMVPFGPNETSRCATEAEAAAAASGPGATGQNTGSGLDLGNEGFRLSDLIGSMVWNRVRGVAAEGQKSFGIPDLASSYKNRKSATAPVFDLGNNQQGRLTKGGGMIWGFVPEEWGG